MGENWKPALLLAAIIPLVMGLQLMALWVIDRLGQEPTAAVATRVDPPPAAVAAPEPGPVVEQPPSRPAPAPAPQADGVTATLSGWDEVRNRRRPPAQEAAPADAPSAEEETVAMARPPQDEVPRQEDTVMEAALEAAADTGTADAFAPGGATDEGDDGSLLDLHHSGWLEQQDPSHYTLQVETAMAPDRLLAFAGERNLPQPQAYYRSFWEARDRYVYALVSGDYADWSEARQAAGELSRRYPGIKPWVRSFADIQQQMRQE